MGSDHCPISLTFTDTTTEVYPTPAGAGNLRKATKPQQVFQFSRFLHIDPEIVLPA
jgi:hypothetical protein